jgi:hypothetical protein
MTIDLGEIAMRTAAATAGPWGDGGKGVSTTYWLHPERGIDAPERMIAKTSLEGDNWFADEAKTGEWRDVANQDSANAEFIAHAREDVPALLAEVERLREVAAAERARGIEHARRVITGYLATAEKWRYDRVVWAFAIMLGEIPEDTPEPGPIRWADKESAGFAPPRD